MNKEGSNDVRYNVTFRFHWNSQDFPLNYPPNAHFSQLIGWSHNVATTFFQVGTLASEGIENMAETGGTSPLDDEINDRIASGEGLELVIGDYLNGGTGNIQVEIRVDPEHPCVTLATMLAPSPDWYVAAVNINLLENGDFVTERSVYGRVYDAGTDLGISYSSDDDDADPQHPISLLVDPPIGNGIAVASVIATVTFSRQ